MRVRYGCWRFTFVSVVLAYTATKYTSFLTWLFDLLWRLKRSTDLILDVVDDNEEEEGGDGFILLHFFQNAPF
jgi:hypothetical protein